MPRRKAASRGLTLLSCRTTTHRCRSDATRRAFGSLGKDSSDQPGVDRTDPEVQAWTDQSTGSVLQQKARLPRSRQRVGQSRNSKKPLKSTVLLKAWPPTKAPNSWEVLQLLTMMRLSAVEQVHPVAYIFSYTYIDIHVHMCLLICFYSFTHIHVYIVCFAT